MRLHTYKGKSDLPSIDEPTTVIVDICSTQVTRLALAAANERNQVLGVTGWVDISSPNLVDLLDDLSHGPGGEKLIDLRVRLNGTDLNNVPIQRGLGTILEAGLGIRFEASYADTNAVAYLRSIGAHPLPDLPVK